MRCNSHVNENRDGGVSVRKYHKLLKMTSFNNLQNKTGEDVSQSEFKKNIKKLENINNSKKNLAKIATELGLTEYSVVMVVHSG